MKRISVIPQFHLHDFLRGLLVLLSCAWIYLYYNTKKHKKKYLEMRLLAHEKIKNGEVDKKKVINFLESAHTKIVINRWILLGLLFVNLGLLAYLLEFG